MIFVKPGFVTAKNVYKVTPVAVFSETQSVWSASEECGTMEEDASPVASASSFYVKMTSLNTKPAVKLLRQRT